MFSRVAVPQTAKRILYWAACRHWGSKSPIWDPLVFLNNLGNLRSFEANLQRLEIVSFSYSSDTFLGN